MRSDGYLIEIFKSFTRESLTPNDPDKKQTQIKQYLNNVSAFIVDIHLIRSLLDYILFPAKINIMHMQYSLFQV